MLYVCVLCYSISITSIHSTFIVRVSFLLGYTLAQIRVSFENRIFLSILVKVVEYIYIYIN